jgi:hypothetical protein
MRTWLKNGIQFTVMATALAATGARMAYSQCSMDETTLLAGRSTEQRTAERGNAGHMGLTEPADGDVLASARPLTRGQIASLAAVALTTAGSVMLIRRLRRRSLADNEV